MIASQQAQRMAPRPTGNDRQGEAPVKSDQLLRLFRAIQSDDRSGLQRLAKGIIREQKAKGHTRLAKQLADILKKSKPTTGPLPSGRPKPAEVPAHQPTPLPMVRGHAVPLFRIVAGDELRHQMALPAEVEGRFVGIEREYAARDLLAARGLEPKKKVLLYGPPGCGKTMGAERLAWHMGLPLMRVQFGSLASAYLAGQGDGAGGLFEETRGFTGVLLLDECDFAASSAPRGGPDLRAAGEASRPAGALLRSPEDWTSAALLVVTAGTYGPPDEAVCHCFDEVIEMQKPTKAEIRNLLQQTLSGVEIAVDVRWPLLIDKLAGASAAHVVAVARDAVKRCIMAEKEAVSQAHLEMAASTILRPA